MEQSPLLVVLKIVVSLFSSPLSPGSSWISGRDPLLVLLYCNNLVFTKIKFCFQCQLIDCLLCLRCLHPRFIDRRLFPPSYLVPDGDRPLPPRHMTFATPGFTRSPSRKPHKTSCSQRNENPCLISKRDIFIARRKMFSERLEREVNAT